MQFWKEIDEMQNAKIYLFAQNDTNDVQDPFFVIWTEY